VSECVWSEPLFFGSDDTVAYLITNDRGLLADIVAHNENRRDNCR
jgi:hypothetical protein